MSRYPATPREFADLMTFLAAVPEGRHAAIARMLFEQVAACSCGQPVRRCDARKLVEGRLVHLACARDAGMLRGDNAHEPACGGGGRSMKPQPVAPVPRVAVTREEAAASLGVSLPHFRRHVQPHVKVIRSGSCRLFLVSELERWARENATLAGGE